MRFRKFKSTGFILFYLLVGMTVSSFAQKKVKYKDLFPLLSSQQFDDAEPFLKDVLADDPELANGNYQMGLLMEHKAKQADILRETTLFSQRADSAILYYSKSKELIDEKELKKREEYYQAFNRRDLRTGKFGIKLSDVHLDIENRVIALQLRTKQILELKTLYASTQAYYRQAQRSYIQIHQQFDDLNDLYLRSDQDTRELMDSMIVNYDSARAHFSRYRDLLGQIQEPGYNQLFVVRDIQDFKTQGLDTADFYSDQIAVWNYANWANNTTKVIEEEVTPLLKDIVDFDVQLGALLQQVNVDSSLRVEDLPSGPDPSIVSRLDKFHPNSFMVPFLQYRIVELRYLMESSPAHNQTLSDTFNIDQLLDTHRIILNDLESADNLLKKIDQVDLAKQAQKYSGFVNQQYGGVQQFEQELRIKNAFINGERQKWRIGYEDCQFKAYWAVNDSDTLPVYLPGDSLELGAYDPAVVEMDSKYRTTTIQMADSLIYLSGFIKGDTSMTSGFVAKIFRSREIIWIKPVNIDLLLSANQDSVQTHLFVFDNPDKTVMFHTLNSSNESGSLPFVSVVVKMDSEGNQVWNQAIELPGAPASFEFDTLQTQSVISLKVLSSELGAGHYDFRELRLDDQGKIIQ